MQKDFIAVTPDSGNGTGTVTVAASENQLENARSSTITIAGGGISRTVNVNQSKGVVTWEYTFTVSNSSLSYNVGGGTQSVTITSTKQKKINGKNTGSPITVQYSRSNSGTGISGSGTNITMSRNSSTSPRSGSVKFTQNESGKTVIVNISQSAATKNVITCTASFYSPNQSPTILKISSKYAVKSAVTIQFFQSNGNLGPELTLNKGESNKEETIGAPGGVFANGKVQLSTVNYESNDNYLYEAVKGW